MATKYRWLDVLDPELLDEAGVLLDGVDELGWVVGVVVWVVVPPDLLPEPPDEPPVPPVPPDPPPPAGGAGAVSVYVPPVVTPFQIFWLLEASAMFEPCEACEQPLLTPIPTKLTIPLLAATALKVTVQTSWLPVNGLA